MRWTALKVAALVLIFTMAVGCAHRRDVRAGDEEMERGNYQTALEHYRSAQARRPNSDSIQQKVDAAEERVLQTALDRIDAALVEGDVERAMVEAAAAMKVLITPDRLDILEAFVEEDILQRAQALFQLGIYDDAVWVMELHIATFGDPLDQVAELYEEIVSTWIAVLTGEGERALQSEKFGAAALRFAKASFLQDEEQLRAQEALQRLYELEGWRVHIASNVEDASLRRITDGVFAASVPPSVFDARRVEDAGLGAHLRLTITEPRFEEWEERETRSGEFQSGTQSVPNPEYEEHSREVARAEERLLDAERALDRAWRDVREAERELRQRQREGRPTSTAENRLERASRDVDRREKEFEDQRYEVERLRIQQRQIDRHVQEPVYSDHFYEVILQRARISTEVRLEIVVPAREFEHVLESTVHEELTTERHTAQPVLNLPAQSQMPPTEREARNSLDNSLAQWTAEFLSTSMSRYRHGELGDLGRLEEEERLERLARFVLLDPKNRDNVFERQLNELAGFEDGADLLLRLGRN